MAERMITLGKKGGVHNVRLASKTVKDRVLLQKLFGELKERYSKRSGGYTRIMRIGFRRGDATEMAILELVEKSEKAPAEEPAPKKGAKKADAPKAPDKAEAK